MTVNLKPVRTDINGSSKVSGRCSEMFGEVLGNRREVVRQFFTDFCLRFLVNS